MLMLRRVARHLAHLPGVDWARATYRERQQNGLFEEKVRIAGRLRSAEFSLQRELEKIRPERRRLSERPRVLGVGHEEWERYGLWPTFRRVCEFDLLSLPTNEPGTWSSAGRSNVANEILARIDNLETGTSVEMVFMYCDSRYIEQDLIRELGRRRIWTVLMGLDDQHKFLRRSESGMTVGQAEVAPVVDLYWTSWKLGADLVVAHGGRPWCAPEAADPAFHFPTGGARDLETVFIGGNYGIRGRLVRYLLSRGFEVTAFGRGWPNGFLSFEQTVKTYSRAKVVLGVGNVGEMSGVFHMKGRDFEVPMCGAVYLTSYNPDLADAFEIGREVLCYSSFQNCSEVLRWILSHPDQQRDLRQRALARATKHHTWQKRLSDLIRVIRGMADGAIS